MILHLFSLSPPILHFALCILHSYYIIPTGKCQVVRGLFKNVMISCRFLNIIIVL